MDKDTSTKAAEGFEFELRHMLTQYMAKGLCVTHAVGTLALMQAEVTHSFFTQMTGEF